MAQIISLAYKPAEGERRPADRFSRIDVDGATLVVGKGIAEDCRRRSDSRQLNVMFAETIEQLKAEGFHTKSGELGEQIVIAGLDPEVAVPGMLLHLGESAVIELVYLRVPCSRFERIQKLPRNSARGRIGFMARVIVGGEVAVGSPVTVESSTNTVL